jgi:hypothetical protein
VGGDSTGRPGFLGRRARERRAVRRSGGFGGHWLHSSLGGARGEVAASSMYLAVGAPTVAMTAGLQLRVRESGTRPRLHEQQTRGAQRVPLLKFPGCDVESDRVVVVAGDTYDGEASATRADTNI